jgi:hypothetical protein
MSSIYKSDAREPAPALALRAPDAAKALGISERALRTLTKSGVIPHVRLGHAVVWPIDLLRKSLLEQARSGNTATDWKQLPR